MKILEIHSLPKIMKSAQCENPHTLPPETARGDFLINPIDPWNELGNPEAAGFVYRKSCGESRIANFLQIPWVPMNSHILWDSCFHKPWFSQKHMNFGIPWIFIDFHENPIEIYQKSINFLQKSWKPHNVKIFTLFPQRPPGENFLLIS